MTAKKRKRKGEGAVIEKTLKELVDSLQHGQVVALVCSGMSAGAGIPTWDKLLELMHAELKERDTGAAEAFGKARADGDDLAAGDIFKASSGVPWEEKADFFRRTFLTGREPTPEHLDLLRLGLVGIITTNYDHLLEDAYARVEGRCPPILFPRGLTEDKGKLGGLWIGKQITITCYKPTRKRG